MREVKEVEVLSDYKLLLTFDNNEKKIKDMTQLHDVMVS